MKQLERPVNLYMARPEPELVDVPAMRFVTVDGRGNPNDGTEYRQAIEALYGAAYGLKFMLRKERGAEYHVSPLESLWWPRTGDEWRWTAMIKVPDDVTPAEFERARADLRRKRPSPAVEKLRLETFAEGLAAQVMHTGPYSAEAPTIERLHAFIRDHGFTFDGRRQRHHEIYLGDPRRAKPEKLRTVIRQPVVKKT